VNLRGYAIKMKDVSVWFNEKCSKCRKLQELLQLKGVNVDYREYLEDAPTVAEIEYLASMYQGPLVELLRSKEQIFADLKLAEAAEQELVEALVKHPHLLNRPILVCGNQAIVARPPELGIEFLDSLKSDPTD